MDPILPTHSFINTSSFTGEPAYGLPLGPQRSLAVFDSALLPPADGPAPKPLLSGAAIPEHVPGEILVQFKPGTSANGRRQVRGLVGGALVEEIRTTSMQRAGQGVLERLSVGSGQGANLDALIAAIARNPNVVFAEKNYLYKPASISNDFYYNNGSLWGMYGDDSPTAAGPGGTTNQFGSQAEKAWRDGITGSSNVVVGIIDEGIQVSHPDLAANIWVNPFEIAGDGIDNDGNGYKDDIHGWDFVSNDNSVYDAGQDAHGTHVAGTIGGVGGNGIGVAGVNWDVTMISAKFLGTNGGTTANAVKAVDYLTDLKTRHGLNLVASNNSWGGGGYSQALHDAIIRHAKADILFVAAAGNSTSNNDAGGYYPSSYDTSIGTSTQTAASYDGVIAVASITNTGAISSFSSYGATTVDIGAPGSAVTSSVPVDSYASYNGTSMATPHVTGAIALYASAQPQRPTAEALKNAILDSATPTVSLAGKTVTGGRLNVYAALQQASFLRLDREVYGLPDTITVSVQDSASNGSNTQVDSVVVTLRSSTETTWESFSLQETGTNTGVFSRAINLVSGAAATDGQLQASHGDTITAFYAALNQTTTALVDTVAPVISNLSASTAASSATLTWSTNEAATSEVRYGLSASNLNLSSITNGATTSHRAVLGGLTPNTSYFYEVVSRDPAGNPSLVGTGSFTTAAPAPILFVDDDQGATYERFYTAALQANGYSYDSWNVASSNVLPTAADLAPYQVVIWTTGYDFSSTNAGLSTAEQNAIQSYLSGGGKLLLSGQDILYNGVSSTFRQSYLKVANFTSDITTVAHTETGVVGNPLSHGLSLTLAAPSDFPSLYTDALTPAADAEGTLLHNVSTTSGAFSAVNYRGPDFAVVFMTSPFEAISTSAANPNNQAAVLKRTIDYLQGFSLPAGVTVSAPSNGSTTEAAGGTVTFTVVLNSAPSAPVTIPVSSNDSTEASVSTTSLVFTPANWSIPQAVTVTGVDDDIDDDNIAYSVLLGSTSSDDSLYNTIDPADVALVNVDNDTAGITVGDLSGTTTSEAGGSATFTVRLNSQPTADVTITLNSSDTTEGSVGPTSLTFTATNWASSQIVTVNGVDDLIYDGTIAYSVVINQASSTDSKYSVLNPADLSLSNLDNDPPPPTKFFVVDDGSSDKTYEYAADGSPVENYLTASGNTAPRGVATIADGSKSWVVDANRNVYVYDAAGGLLGSWTLGTVASNAQLQGIATDGTHLWVVDARADRVYYYANAASRLAAGTLGATNSFALASGNTSPTDLVFGTGGSNGAAGSSRTLWVVNNASTDRVYRYTLGANNLVSGTTTSWLLNSANSTPTGITLDPTNSSQDIWVVDSGTDRVYRYADGRNLAAPTLTSSFALAAGNTNPQGIADPMALPAQPSGSGDTSTTMNSTSSIDSASMPALDGLSPQSIPSWRRRRSRRNGIQPWRQAGWNKRPTRARS